MSIFKHNAIETKTTNPYTKDGIKLKATDDRYMNLALSKKNWQIANLGLLIANIIMALILGYVAIHSKVETRVALVNDGMVLNTLKTEELEASQKSRLITSFLTQFISNARLVSSDEILEKKALNSAYSSVADQAVNYLNDWYAKNDPFSLVASYTVAVDIVNTLDESPTTMQIIWDETRRSVVDGAVLGTTRWYARLTYDLTEPKPNQLKDNPFGIYINHLTWSQVQ